MGRLIWNLLRLVAWYWRWAWVHLVSDRNRQEWARIAAAMSARSLHVVDWADGDSPLPAWVPCGPCGGIPCQSTPMATSDAYTDRLARILGDHQDD